MADQEGQHIGNYRLSHLLGRGGFADVYLGQHIYLETQAAIKVLHTRLGSSDLEGFLSEARTIARLEHPHIVRILDFGQEDGVPFLVMAYAPNGTLRARHPRGTTVPLINILQYVKQIASALQYAHEHKVIHRDVKPENMLLGRTDEVLLSDFGIALVAQTTQALDIQVQDKIGTVAYMAPEQFQGKPRYASDQYSLGIIVYEWLSGERPFQGSFTEVVSQHLLAPPPPLHEKVAWISLEVEQIVLMALNKDYRERFRSIQTFANALEQASQSYLSSPAQPTVLISPPSPERIVPTATLTPDQRGSATPRLFTPRPLQTPARETTVPPQPQVTSQSPLSRRRVVVGLGLGLVVLAGTAGGIYWLGQGLKPPLVSKASTPPVPLGTRLVIYRGHVLPVYALAWSPTGQSIVSASNDGTVQIWDATTGRHIFTYRGHRGSVNAVAWSADGTRIASAGSDQTVQVWLAPQAGEATFSGKPLVTYRGHSANMRTLAWSPNGNLIASGGDDKTVQVWVADNGNPLFTYHGHSNRIWSVAWSPDGTRIVSGSVDKTAKMWSASSGSTLVTYTGHTSEVKAVAWSPDSTRIVSASDDKTAQVWEAASGNPILTYAGHTDVLNAVAWTPNDKHIVTGSGDYSVHIWDASSGAAFFIYRGHALAVHAVAWSPDKQRIASASDDWSVQVWRAI